VLDEGYLLGTWNIDTMSISTGEKAAIVIVAENGFLRAKTLPSIGVYPKV
jgi:hypothetical protein